MQSATPRLYWQLDVESRPAVIPEKLAILLRIGAAVALALGLLYVFSRQADAAAVLATIKGTRIEAAVLALVLSLLIVVYRAFRWRVLLRPMCSVDLATLTKCTLMGWTVTVALPGRLGEIVKPALLAKEKALALSGVLATVLLERLFDLFALLLLLALYLLLLPLPSNIDDAGVTLLTSLRTVGALTFVGVTSVFAALIVGLRRQEGLVSVVGRILSRVPARFSSRLEGVAHRFLEGMAGLRDIRFLLVVLIHSLLIWFLTGAFYYSLLWGVGIALPLSSAIPITVLAVLGMSVPTPAAAGAFHIAVQVALVSLWSIDTDLASSYALVTHAIAVFPAAILGGLVLWREGWSFGRLRRLRAIGESRSHPPAGSNDGRPQG